MTDPLNIEIGYGLSQHVQSFAAGSEAAGRALGSISALQPSVALVFASVHYSLPELMQGVSTVLGSVPTIGSTTAGEICGSIHHHSVLVIVMASPYLKVRYGLGRNVSRDWNRALEEALDQEPLRPFFQGDPAFWRDLKRSGTAVFAMLFSPGDTGHALSPSYEILETLKTLSLGRFPIFGGSSTDDWNMEANYVLSGQEAVQDSVLVAIFETKLQFGIAMSHGFRALPLEATVTSAEGKEILALDGRPAAEAYADMLKSTRQELEGKHLALTTGRAVGIKGTMGDYSINIPLSFTERGGVITVQQVPPGAVLTLMEGKPESMAAATPEALQKAMLRGNISKPALSLVCYCALRPRIIGDKAQEELARASGMTGAGPLLGFCSLGEQGLADDGTSRHNNGSVSVLVIGQELSQTALVARENEELHSRLEQKVLERTEDLNRANQMLTESLQEMTASEEYNHHLNTVLKAIRDVNQLIVREHDPDRLLDQACEILVQTRGYRLAWIGRAKPGQKYIEPKARAGLGADYLDLVRVPWDDGEARLGPTGMALKTGWLALCQSTYTDPDFRAWREAAMSHGLRSVLAVPMISGSVTFGVLTVYADHPQAFDDEEIGLIKELAGDLAFGLQSLENEAERKKAEEALRESKEFLDKIINSIGDPVFVKDRAHRMILVNDAICKSFGRDRDEILGRTSYEIFSSSTDAGLSWEKDEEVLRTGVENVSEETIAFQPGVIRTTLIKKTLYTDKSGDRFIVGIARDITELRRALSALQDSERQLANIIDFLPDSTFVIDMDGKVISWNRAMEELTEIRAEDMVGRGDYEYALPFYGERRPILIDLVLRPDSEVEKGYENLLRQGKISAEGYAPMLKGGIHLFMTATALYDSAGDPIGAIESIRDMTDRKKAEEKLRESESKSRAILDAVPDMMFQIERDGTFLDFKSSSDDLYVPPEQYIGRKMQDVMPPSLVEQAMHYLGRASDTGETQAFEYSLEIDGRKASFEARIAICRESSFLAIVRNITERKRLEKTLARELNRFRVLYDLSLNLSAERSLEDNLAFIVEKSRELLDADTSYIALLDESGSHVRMHTLSGIRTEAFRQMHLPLGKGLYGLVMETHKGQIIDDYFEDRGIVRVVDKIIEDEGLISGMAAPVQIMDKSLGALYVFNRKKTLFSQADLETLSLLGNLAAVEITRKQSSEALSEQLSFLQQLMNAIPSPLFFKGMDGRYQGCNMAFERFIGKGKEEIIGKTVWDLYPPDLAERHHQMDETLLTSPGEQVYESSIKHADGAQHDVVFSKATYFDTEGRIAGLVGVFLDITDCRTVEEALRESEARYRRLFENSPAGIISIDINGRITEVNEALVRVMGSPSAEATKEINIFEFPLLVKAGLSECFARCIQSGEPVFYERPYVSRWGKPIYLRLRLSPIRDARGIITGAQGTVEDISEQKQAEEALRESEMRYRALAESSQDAIYMVSPDMRMMYINSFAARALETRQEEIAGKSLDQFFPPEAAEMMTQRMQKVFQTGKPFMFENKLVFCQGVRWENTSLAPIKDQSGRVTAVFGVSRDVTDRKLAEHKLVSSLREKEVLLKEIHHRVKNNLQIISSLLSIQASYLHEEGTRSILMECQGRVKSMALIHESLYRSENLARVSFANYIRNLTRALLRSYTVSKNEVRLSLELDEIFLSIDQAIPCGLILNELVTNCIKHAFPGGGPGEIRIDLLRYNELIMLIVKDNGIGLPEESELEKRKSMGLKLVYSLVRQLKGTIEIERGQGTEFKITFSES